MCDFGLCCGGRRVDIPSAHTPTYRGCVHHTHCYLCERQGETCVNVTCGDTCVECMANQGWLILPYSLEQYRAQIGLAYLTTLVLNLRHPPIRPVPPPSSPIGVEEVRFPRSHARHPSQQVETHNIMRYCNERIFDEPAGRRTPVGQYVPEAHPVPWPLFNSKKKCSRMALPARFCVRNTSFIYR